MISTFSAKSELVRGLSLASLAGFLATLTWGVINGARGFEEERAGCRGGLSQISCPEAIHEEFDPLGSWQVSFSIGAAVVCCVSMGLLRAMTWIYGTPMPALCFQELRIPASAAGLCW